ncbi:unnamed protein product [Meloidogyne enterolobii]|uniref:Uncharacterized protein n=1 Tax=Meloidogyne enterolobii TaxID=390850 RepID=A0ACB0ZBZ9_MELEN
MLESLNKILASVVGSANIASSAHFQVSSIKLQIVLNVCENVNVMELLIWSSKYDISAANWLEVTNPSMALFTLFPAGA